MHAQSQDNSADEYEIRAAMLLNISKFVTWPSWKMDADHKDFTVCVLGSGPLGPYLDRLLQHQQLNGKTIVVRHIASPEAADLCHILYASSEDRRKLTKANDLLAKNAVLTVTEASNANDGVQIIGLPTVDEHVHIDINLANAQKSGLTISSRLLQLATVTH